MSKAANLLRLFKKYHSSQPNLSIYQNWSHKNYISNLHSQKNTFLKYALSKNEFWNLLPQKFNFQNAFSKNTFSKLLSQKIYFQKFFLEKIHLERLIRTSSQMHRADKYSQHSSIICPIWLNVWVFVYKLSSCGFESSRSHLNFRYRTCFEQGVP